MESEMYQAKNFELTKRFRKYRDIDVTVGYDVL